MRIEVWSDLTCPWCFLGKRRLDQAVSALGADVEVFWRPYLVDPAAPTAGEPRDPERARRFMALHSEEDLAAYLDEIGGQWRPRWRASTFDGHRLVTVALQQGGPSLQGAVVEELQRAHFVRGENLGDHDVLVHAATSAGLVGARGALDTGAAADQVRADVVAATLRGVNAAPTFVVGNRAIVGAQEPEALLEFLRTANAPAEPSATVCALIDHADPVWAFRRAEELLDSRNPLDALKALRPVLADYGDNTSVLLLAARAHFASAQLGRAESTLRRILELDPTDHYAVFMLGRTLQRQGRADEARTQFRLAAAMSPQQDHLEALADLG